MDFGAIIGTILLGLFSDILPFRSPLYEFAIILGGGFGILLTYTAVKNFWYMVFVVFFLGFLITGASGVIAAIECDIGRKQQVSKNRKSLATISGVIDGIASFGSAIGMLLIGEMKKAYGWSSTFLMMSICIFLSGIPALYFLVREVQEWRMKRAI